MRVGVAGLGRMGSAMAERLLDTGHTLVVWNRTPGRAEPLVARGATVAESAQALAGQVELVLSMLFDDAAAEAVHAELRAGAVPGTVLLEMSTLLPKTQVALDAAARAAGLAYVECPVGGTVGPARTGQLLGLAGGEADAVARVRPVLESLCRRVEHVGPVGAGASMKLAINLPLLVFWQAFGEANALIRHLGLDPTWLVSLFGETAGGPNVLRGRAGPIAKALSGDDPGPVTFSVEAICKDLRTMQAAAAERRFALPVAGAALAVMEDARAAGWGERDCAWLPTLWADKGGTKTRLGETG